MLGKMYFSFDKSNLHLCIWSAYVKFLDPAVNGVVICLQFNKSIHRHINEYIYSSFKSTKTIWLLLYLSNRTRCVTVSLVCIPFINYGWARHVHL